MSPFKEMLQQLHCMKIHAHLRMKERLSLSFLNFSPWNWGPSLWSCEVDSKFKSSTARKQGFSFQSCLLLKLPFTQPVLCWAVYMLSYIGFIQCNISVGSLFFKIIFQEDCVEACSNWVGTVESMCLLSGTLIGPQIMFQF